TISWKGLRTRLIGTFIIARGGRHCCIAPSASRRVIPKLRELLALQETANDRREFLHRSQGRKKVLRRVLKTGSAKKYRPPRPKDMKGGCSPQNDQCLNSSAAPCNKNFKKFSYKRRDRHQLPPARTQMPDQEIILCMTRLGPGSTKVDCL